MNLIRFSKLCCTAMLAGSSFAVPPAALQQDAAPAHSPDAQNAIKSFKFDEGLKVQLFAAEPLLANPVAFAVDERGRWFIAESYRQERGVEDNRAHANWLNDDIAARTVEDRLATMKKFYPDPQKFAEKFAKFEERIVRIEDTNGDGIADKQTVFADGFRDPLDGTGAGIIARGTDVWWTCIPNLWHFRDADDDGKAEVKEKLLSGFGVKFAFRGHDMHGLRFGPDGKLYFSMGDRGTNVKTKEGAQVAEPDTGSVMRCNPDGTGLEIFAIGLRNPQELAFDEFGNLFTGDNNSDGGDKARFLYLVEGGDCGWRMTYQYLNDRGPWNREKLWDENEALKAKYVIPPIANISSGPSGLTYNPGTGLSDKYKGRFYLSDFLGGASASVVHEVALSPAGAWFKLKSREFLKGVLTTDVEFGTDGSLYVLDWAESWSGVGKGRIYKFTDSAANTGLQAETQKLLGEGMSTRPEIDVVKLLGHPDMRVRMAAQFALAEKGEAAAAALSKLAVDGKAQQLARLHAIWALGQIAEKNPQALAPLSGLLADADGEVRAQAAKVLGDRHAVAAGDALVALLKDQSLRVRFFAAQSLGKLAHKPAVEALFAALAENNDQDPILRHGCVMALRSCATPEQLVAKAADNSVAARVGALLALRQQRNSQITAFLKDPDESVLLEAVRAIHDVPINDAMPALAAVVLNKGIKNPHILLRVVNANYRVGKSENARVLASFAAEASAPDGARRDALEALGEWGHPDPKDRIMNLWRPLPDRPANDATAAISPLLPALLVNSPGSIQEAAAKVAAKLSITSAGESLLQLASHGQGGNAAARIAAIQALAALKDPRLAEAAKAAVAAKDPRVRSAGLQALSRQDPVAAVKVIGDIINSSGSTIERQGALLALTQINRPEARALLESWMDKLIAGQAPAEIQLDIYEAAKKAGLSDRVAKYKAALPSNDPLASYKLSLAGGDIDRGRKIFREKAEVQCLRCHKCEIGDSVVGPDLTHIGAQKDRAYILESIVFPNKTIAAGFQIVVLTLKDNNVVAGRLLGEDAAGVKVETLDEQGKPKTVIVAAAQIAQRSSAPSPMPENIRDQLSRTELRDVVEYIATRK